MSDRLFSVDHGSLDGTCVVEVGDGVAVAYAGKLLAELGAKVVRFESAHEGSLRLEKPHLSEHRIESSAAHLYLNACKHSVLRDDSDRGQRLFSGALGLADVILVGLEPCIGAHQPELEDVVRAGGGKVVVTISPYGVKGPRMDWKAFELNSWAAGGMAFVTPSNSPNVVGSPLQTGVALTGYVAGLHAAFVALALLRQRVQSGAGGRADVSLQAAAASLIDSAPIGRYVSQGVITGRASQERGAQLAGFWQCSDGHVLLLGIGDKEWAGFAQLLGHPEWLEDERFRTAAARGVNAGLLSQIIEEWTRARKKDDVAASAQQLGCPASPVYSVAELRESEQLRARQYFVKMDHPRTGPLDYVGAPYKLSGARWKSRPAELIDESRELLEAMTAERAT